MEMLAGLCNTDPAISYLKLSRKGGHYNALLDGMIEVKENADIAPLTVDDIYMKTMRLTRYVIEECKGNDEENKNCLDEDK